jgi:hypothetical protein
MLGSVLGLRIGVAKEASPVVVRVSDNQVYSPAEWLAALAAVNVDLGDEDSTTITAIMLLAVRIPPSAFVVNGVQTDMSVFERSAFLILNRLVSKGVLPVTGTGNDGNPTINSIPQNFAKSGEQAPSLTLPALLCVAGITPDGTELYPKSESLLPRSDISREDSLRTTSLLI